jgi:hypothetical protein
MIAKDVAQPDLKTTKSLEVLLVKVRHSGISVKATAHKSNIAVILNKITAEVE